MCAWCRLLIFWFCAGMLSCPGQDAASARPEEPVAGSSSQILTNVSQFRAFPIQNYLRGYSFQLTGTVTLVDTNRNLLFLQDATGAVAVNLGRTVAAFKPGQLVSISGSNGSPYVASFPDYPYKPSGWGIQRSFEAPSNWGDYHLTRMRGHLHPPVNGNYTFWIASDNMGELWLSPDDGPGRVRRIAFVREWVDPHEWFRDAAQRSETIFLRSDRDYYIEAFQEQLTSDDHLSVAWQGPGLNRAVIDGRYLTPWTDKSDQTPFDGTNGILREYWTNYFNGGLVGITGPRPFDSALSAETIQATILGQGTMPEPKRIRLNQQLMPEDKYRWVEAEGTVSFVGIDGASVVLDLNDGQGQAQVRLSNWKERWPTNAENWTVRVQGVCEGARNLNGMMIPGLIWTATEHSLTFIESATNKNQDSLLNVAVNSRPLTDTNPALGGFYYTRGVVTFNDRVFGQPCLFVQEGDAAIFISQDRRDWGNKLQVGQSVGAGGDLLPSKYIPVLRPLALSVLDWSVMPEPVEPSLAGDRDGRWTELEGVVRSLNPDGTLRLRRKNGVISIWVGRSSTNELARWVNSTLRARGVMSLTLTNNPMLLVPSRNFVQTEAEPSADPFDIPPFTIANLAAAHPDVPWGHRSKTTAVVTYKNGKTLFVQDSSGGARVQTSDDLSVQIGDPVEIIGFLETDTSIPTLTDALVRPASAREPAPVRRLDLNELTAGGRGGTLIKMTATLLGQKSKGVFDVLELLEGPRVFEALLATNQGTLPPLATGSRVQIIGVCDTETGDSAGGGKGSVEIMTAGTIRIWLRSPQDVVLLRGPPWWTWRKVAALIGMMLTVLAGAMLWIHFLRRRLERQHATQLAFSRQILQSQESERRRIAANLHDGLGQNLLVIKNQARLAMQPVKDESALQRRLDEISGMASQALEEVRQITHDLRPYQLDRLGLTQAVRTAANQVSQSSPIVLASDVEDIDGLYDKESEIHIYRIVQESINNIVKHSGATEATVVIKRQPGTISLSIRDNGRGFDTGSLSSDGSAPGFGLSGISERTRILGGNLTVSSRPGEGTDLRIEIPVSYS